MTYEKTQRLLKEYGNYHAGKSTSITDADRYAIDAAIAALSCNRYIYIIVEHYVLGSTYEAIADSSYLHISNVFRHRRQLIHAISEML